MIPLPAVVKEWLQKSIWLTSYILILVIICFVSVSSYVLTWRFAVHLNRSLVELVGLVIEKTEVVYLKLFPCVVIEKDISSHLRSCKFSDPENEVDLILSLAGIFETLTDIDDFTICPTHRCWVELWFQ